MAGERDTSSNEGPTGEAAGEICPWCSAPAETGAARCGSCGAAIAQRESIAGLVIPGVTAVDPNLVADGSPASPVLRSQGTANVLYAATHVNATFGLAAAAAVLGQDAIRGMLGGNEVDPTKIGVPSEAAVLAVEQLEREATPEAEPAPVDEPPASDPWSDLPGG